MRENRVSQEKEEASRGVCKECVCVCVCERERERERDEAGVKDVGSLLCSRQGPVSRPHPSSLTTSVCSH